MLKHKMNIQLFADDDIAGLLSKGTKLTYKEGTGTAKQIAAVKSIPAVGSDPEKVDVTHLESDAKVYIEGLQDTDNYEFAIVYQGKNFKDVHTLVESKKSVDWTITYPDGMTVEFSGTASYKIDGAEVNSAIGFNLVIVVGKAPKVTPAP